MEKKRIVEILIKVGASTNGLKAFLNWEGTLEEFVIRYPQHILCAYGKIKQLRNVIDEMVIYGECALHWCARQVPGDAIAYVRTYLSSNVLEECIRKDPIAALQYAARNLTAVQLEWCAKNAPETALNYAEDVLPPLLLEWCKNDVYNA